MAYANGRLPSSALGRITHAANGGQAFLRKDAARAFMAMNAESERRFGVTLRVSSPRVAYRTLAEQWYFWNLYRSGRGALAAYPGTSNHGWGLAIDLASPAMRRIVDSIGAKYGFAKRWSDAPSEWWHIKWKAGNYPAVRHSHTDPVLRPGAHGHSVRVLKVLMWRQGLRKFDRHTAVYGPEAVAAIKRLQRKHGLHADGIVGNRTWKVLR